MGTGRPDRLGAARERTLVAAVSAKRARRAPGYVWALRFACQEDRSAEHPVARMVKLQGVKLAESRLGRRGELLSLHLGGVRLLAVLMLNRGDHRAVGDRRRGCAVGASDGEPAGAHDAQSGGGGGLAKAAVVACHGLKRSRRSVQARCAPHRARAWP